jgi:uncharacterized membrane protein YphA (DoxX/SURF4 family)
MKIFTNKYLLFVIRITIGALFIYSAAVKIMDNEYFVKSVENYKILSPDFIKVIAFLIPSLELIIGTFILLGIFTKESAALGGLMMIVFIAAIIIALSRGLNIDCGCFGTKTSSKVGFIKIIENFFILLGFLWLAFSGSDFFALIKSTNNKISNQESTF